MALIEKLSAIGQAIRDKTGATNLMSLDEMAIAISTISGGEVSTNSYTYESIVSNEDGTFTLIDTESTIHTLSATYDDNGAITSVTFDNKTATVTYDEIDPSRIIWIGETAVDFSKVATE